MSRWLVQKYFGDDVEDGRVDGFTGECIDEECDCNDADRPAAH